MLKILKKSLDVLDCLTTKMEVAKFSFLNEKSYNKTVIDFNFSRHKDLSILKSDICLFVCFVALRPKSTAMVIAGRSVHLTTLFSWASLNKQLTSNRAHTFACN